MLQNLLWYNKMQKQGHIGYLSSNKVINENFYFTLTDWKYKNKKDLLLLLFFKLIIY